MADSSATAFPPVLTLKEASTLLRIPPPTLHELLNAGAIQSYRVGRRRYIPGESAAAFINNLTRTTADSQPVEERAQ